MQNVLNHLKKKLCPTSGTTFNLQNFIHFYMLSSISVVVTRGYIQFFRIFRSISLVFNLCGGHCFYDILHVILINYASFSP